EWSPGYGSAGTETAQRRRGRERRGKAAERFSSYRESNSLRLDAALLDHPPPLLLLAGEVRGRFLGAARDHGQAAILVELHLVRSGEHFADVRIQRVDDRARRA